MSPAGKNKLFFLLIFAAETLQGKPENFKYKQNDFTERKISLPTAPFSFSTCAPLQTPSKKSLLSICHPSLYGVARILLMKHSRVLRMQIHTPLIVIIYLGGKNDYLSNYYDLLFQPNSSQINMEWKVGIFWKFITVKISNYKSLHTVSFHYFDPKTNFFFLGAYTLLTIRTAVSSKKC